MWKGMKQKREGSGYVGRNTMGVRGGGQEDVEGKPRGTGGGEVIR